ncbi:MAG TPA: DUF4421 domain-containing protein [Ohtaekwangia sp.]
MVRYLFIVCLVVTCFANDAKGQILDSLYYNYDSSYYISHDHKLAGRFFFSQKYTAFRFYDRTDKVTLNYLPNTTLNMGIGGTYKWATLNLAFGFPFLNPNQKKGDTKYLDLQCHLYGRRFVIDAFGQFYSGFYLRNKSLRDVNGDYYDRPDIKINQIGVSAQYMLNYKRFSYRAGFLQNEWQKKSAGTVLVGLHFVLGRGEADSTLIPSAISNVPTEPQRQELLFIDMGPSIGYAYTLVIDKHFFIMGSATAILTAGRTQITGAETERSSTFLPNFSVKAFAGYNSKEWAISATWTNDTVIISANENDQTFSLSTGNVRLNFVKRFRLRNMPF